MDRFELSTEHVPEDLIWLCDIVGITSFLEIIDTAGGEFLYLPKRQTLEAPLRRAAICREFDGGNFKQLARKYGITERRVRMIVKECGEERTGGGI